VGVIDADQGLFSSDFRASERLAQLLVQVAGRAGRGARPGEVLIQTHCPEHPLLHTLVTQGYDAFARQLLTERERAGLPPYGALALLRAEAKEGALAEALLNEAAHAAAAAPGVSVLGPVPAPMARRAGRERRQLLLQAAERAPLRQALRHALAVIEASPDARRVRWSVDVDPVEMF
jgi:primosomal protein N' (replication factor Y)